MFPNDAYIAERRHYHFSNHIFDVREYSNVSLVVKPNDLVSSSLSATSRMTLLS